LEDHNSWFKDMCSRSRNGDLRALSNARPSKSLITAFAFENASGMLISPESAGGSGASLAWRSRSAQSFAAASDRPAFSPFQKVQEEKQWVE
jgi:hypothetical protein